MKGEARRLAVLAADNLTLSRRLRGRNIALAVLTLALIGALGALVVSFKGL